MPTFDTPPAFTVDLDSLWRLIASCHPEHPDYHPKVAGGVAQAQMLGERGHDAGWRRWGSEALALFLLIDHGLLDNALLTDQDAARRLAEDLMDRFPYGRIPDRPPRFPLGDTVIDNRLKLTLRPEDCGGLLTLFARHERGDWGDWDYLGGDIEAINTHCVTHGQPIVSQYRLPGDRRVLIVTNADRTTTTARRAEDQHRPPIAALVSVVGGALGFPRRGCTGL